MIDGIKVTIDTENNAETWWDNGGRELWAEFFGADAESGNLSGQDYSEFRRRAIALPGFDTGPEYAPTPFIAAVCPHDWQADGVAPADPGISQGYHVRCSLCGATGYQRAGWCSGNYRAIGKVVID
jgi:hypothetical protein